MEEYLGNFEYVSTNRGIERYHNRKLHVSIDDIETTGPDSPTLLWSLQEAFNFKSELIRVSGEHQWALEALTVSLTVFKIIIHSQSGIRQASTFVNNQNILLFCLILTIYFDLTMQSAKCID